MGQISGGGPRRPTVNVNSPSRQQVLDDLGNFQGQFYNVLGIPARGLSPFQEWQDQQFNTTLAAYQLGHLSNPDRTFADYLNTRGILGAREDIGTGYEGLLRDAGAASDTRELLGEQTWKEIIAEQARAKRGQFYGGDTFTRRLPRMELQYEATPEGLGTPTTYGFMNNILRAYFGV